MADFSRHKNQHDAFIQFAQFLVDLYQMYASGNFLWMIYGLLALTRYAPKFKDDKQIFFKIKFEHFRLIHAVKFNIFRWNSRNFNLNTLS